MVLDGHPRVCLEIVDLHTCLTKAGSQYDRIFIDRFYGNDPTLVS